MTAVPGPRSHDTGRGLSSMMRHSLIAAVLVSSARSPRTYFTVAYDLNLSTPRAFVLYNYLASFLIAGSVHTAVFDGAVFRVVDGAPKLALTAKKSERLKESKQPFGKRSRQSLAEILRRVLLDQARPQRAHTGVDRCVKDRARYRLQMPRESSGLADGQTRRRYREGPPLEAPSSTAAPM